MKCCVYTRAFLETPYLDFFIEHYVKLGFDKIIILKADDIPYECPQQYQSNVDIHTVQNLGNELLPKYDYLVKQSGCDWCLCVDVDEILLLHKQYGCIQDFICTKTQENAQINIFYFRWAIIEKFDIQYPESLSSILDTYQLFSNQHIKTLVKISELSSIHHPHMCTTHSKTCIYFEDQILTSNSPKQEITSQIYKESVLIHLHTRSIHNLIIKSFHTLFFAKQIKEKQLFIDFVNNIDISSRDNIGFLENFKSFMGVKAKLPFSHASYPICNIKMIDFDIKSNYSFDVIDVSKEYEYISKILLKNGIEKEQYDSMVNKLYSDPATTIFHRRIYKIWIDNQKYNYHFEVIESVIQKYYQILNTKIVLKDIIFYLSIVSNPTFESYILGKYSNIVFTVPEEYDYYISITIYDKDYDNIVKNSNKEFYISHQITNRLEVLSNVWFLTPLAKKSVVADILPYSDQLKLHNIPIYIVQGNLNQGRRNLQLLKNILNVDYKLPFVIKMIGRGVLPPELEEYKNKIVLRNGLNFSEYHREFLDAYCILPLITKSTHPQYYTYKLTSTINYARGYKMKCLIDQDLQNIYHLSDVEVFMHEKDIVCAFQKTLHDFYKMPTFTEN